MFHDGQPEPEASMLSCARRIGLTKAFEDMREELRVDALAGVGDRDFDVRADLLQSQLYSAALGCELNRIREHVPQHLLQARRIS